MVSAFDVARTPMFDARKTMETPVDVPPKFDATSHAFPKNLMLKTTDFPVDFSQGLGHQPLAHLQPGPADASHGRLAWSAGGDHQARHRCGGGRDEDRPRVAGFYGAL